MRKNTQADIWRRIDMSGGPDACWPWQGQRVGDYGSVRYGPNSPHPVHRLIYEWVNNESIPDGITVHHTCFNTICQNPRHLTLKTRPENSSLKEKRVTNICSRGHDLTITGRIIREGHRQCTECLKITAAAHYEKIKSGDHAPRKQTACKRGHPEESMKQHPDGRWYCAACKRITNKKPPVPKSDTCRAGHDYATHGKVNPDGTRRCVTCHNDRRRERYAAKKS
jgi:hypothetical protein